MLQGKWLDTAGRVAGYCRESGRILQGKLLNTAGEVAEYCRRTALDAVWDPANIFCMDGEGIK